MKILVTGGAGFIGHHLSNLLSSMGHDVEVWDNLSVGKKDRLDSSITFREIDLLNDSLPPFEFDCVYHLASPTSVPESLENPKKYEDGCYKMTKRVVDECRKFQVKNMIFSSTSAVYGDTDEFPTNEKSKLNPMSPYAHFKYMAEDYIHSVEPYCKTKFTICRFFNVFGEEQHDSGSYAPAVAIFMKQFHNGEALTVTGDGLQSRDYIYVGDVCDFLTKCADQNQYKLETFNLGFGYDIKILDIASTFNRWIQFIEKRVEPHKSLADITKAKNQYNWNPKISVTEWIRQQI